MSEIQHYFKEESTDTLLVTPDGERFYPFSLSTADGTELNSVLRYDSFMCAPPSWYDMTPCDAYGNDLPVH